MKWQVDLHNDFVPEYHNLHSDVQDQLLAHVELLEQFGPQLGRPRADTLTGSRHANIKELRFEAADGHGASRLHSTLSAGRSSCAVATNQALVRNASTAK